LAFLVPSGLLALIALPIIVWFHLVRERRRRVIVPSLLLWQEISNKTDNQRRLRLPLTLLLFLHLLAAALLALALGQPQWLGGRFKSGNHLALIIDSSTSMDAREGAGLFSQEGRTRLDQAREQARSLINGLAPGDSLTLISAGPRARVIAMGTHHQRTGLLNALDTLASEGVGSDLSGALTLAQAALDTHDGGRIVVLSDNASPAISLLAATVSTRQIVRPGTDIEWLTVGSDRSNRAIVAFGARPTNRSITPVYARVANYGSAPVEMRVLLFGDEHLLDTRYVNLPADGEADLTWEVPAGIRVLRAELEGQDALAADDRASLILEQTRPVQVVLVSAQPKPLERALMAIRGVSVVVVDPAAYTAASAAARADLTIFEGMLPDQLPPGGVLLVHPPEAGNALLTVDATRPVSAPARVVVPPDSAANSLFDGLSLDSVTFATARVVQLPAWAAVQVLADDVPLIVRGQVDRSQVSIWTFDLTRSNLSERLAFPLLVARTVRDLTPAPLPVSMLAGELLGFQPGAHAETLTITAPTGQTRQIDLTVPATSIHIEDLTQTGVYTIAERAGDSVLYEQRIAVNAGSPAESDLRPRPVSPDLITASTNLLLDSSDDTTQPVAQPLWPWLALATLTVMVIEWIYIHR